MKDKQTILKLANVVKCFNKNIILNNLSFSLFAGEFLTLIGPNGCGKTTLIKLIAGLDKDYSGEITLKNITSEKISFIFQSKFVLPWYTVKENLQIRLLNFKLPNVEKNHLINKSLAELGIAQYADFYPLALSGGTKQKVALACALVASPELLILDEPFSAIDADSKQEFYKLICDLKVKYNLTVLLITHDLTEAVNLSDRILFLSNSPTEIINEKYKNNWETEAQCIESCY